jgi:PAS domain S-box-containing protein
MKLTRLLRLKNSQLFHYWRALPESWQGVCMLAIPSVCLLFSVGCNALLQQEITKNQLNVVRTQQVLQLSHTVLISLVNAETGTRGYLITQRSDFLEPYNKALSELEPALTHLQSLVQEQPNQAQRAREITQLARQQLQILQNQVRDSRQNADTSGALTPQIVESKAAMDQLRAKLAAFNAQENQLLVHRSQTLKRQQDMAVGVIWSSLIISSLATLLAVYLLRLLCRELKEWGQRLTASRKLMQAIVANVVDGVIIIDPHNQIVTFNRAAVQMFGYTPTEVIGLSWKRLLNLDLGSPVGINGLSDLEAELRQGKLCQAVGCRKDGSVFPLEISISSIDLANDQIVIFRDISDRVTSANSLDIQARQLINLNAALTQTNQRLAERNHELEQFTYVAAHDLKAPLRAITNLSGWLEEDLAERLPADNARQIRLLRGRVFRMEALLNGLLEYARIGRTLAPIETVDVSLLLTQVLESLAPHPDFQIEMDPDLPIFQTRRNLLKQVFVHLIDNAIRHHPQKKGHISISVQDRGDYFEFAVTDDGQGIDPQFHTKIFTIFQTLKARDIQENTGIGLAIVKKIVELEGGRIALESASGSGAIFRFTWIKEPIGINNVSQTSLH